MTVSIDVVIGIVTRGDHVLICRRPSHTILPGHWEFPGGKRESGESLEICLSRELTEELAIVVEPTIALPTLEHDYPTGRICLHPYFCRLVDGEPRPIACDEMRWVHFNQIAHYQFPPANGPLLERIVAHLAAARANAGGLSADATPASASGPSANSAPATGEADVAVAVAGSGRCDDTRVRHAAPARADAFGEPRP